MKLCWQGLDKWASEKQLAKFIANLLTDPTGVSLAKPRQKSFAFLSFEEKAKGEQFMELASNQLYQKRKIKLKAAAGEKESLRFQPVSIILQDKPPAITMEAKPLGPIELKVTPLYEVPYEDQLVQKQQTVEEAYRKYLLNLGKSIKKQGLIAPNWMNDPPKLEKIQGSPVTEEYRNKMEFTIGYNEHRELAVGFSNGQMAAGTIRVDAPDNCINIPQSSITLAHKLESLLRESNLPPFDIKTSQGVWKLAVIRVSTYHSDSLLIVHVTPNEQIDEIKATLERLQGEVDSVCICIENTPQEIVPVFGKGFITESILGKTFKISPLSFFQVNTKGCEVLYSQVKPLIDTEVLLDICCGAGSIGIACAESAKIIGVELIPEAVEDAKENAQLNGVNAEYHAGKAEILMKNICASIAGTPITGIVDPPRSGLHKDVLKALRTTHGLDNLVYVSCNPNSLFANLYDLSAPESKKIRGPPFYPLHVQPVDMFPHTPHVECVVHMRRMA